MTKPSRTTNTMEVSFAVLRKVEINDNVDRLNINASCEEV